MTALTIAQCLHDEPVACPPPGIYPGVSHVDYLSWQAIDHHALQAASRSLAHYQMRPPAEVTPTMRLGQLCHTGRLKPLLLAQRYVVMPRFEDRVRRPDGSSYDKPRLTTAYRELADNFQRTNADKIIVTQEEYDAMVGVVTSLTSHPRALSMLTGEVEVSLVWRDDTGLLCKARIDCWRREESRIAELKTTPDALRFEQQLLPRGCHCQMAFVCDGLARLTGQPHGADIVVVETTPPFGVRAAPLSRPAMQRGREDSRRLLDQIATACDTHHWPGYDSPDEWGMVDG